MRNILLHLFLFATCKGNSRSMLASDNMRSLGEGYFGFFVPYGPCKAALNPHIPIHNVSASSESESFVVCIHSNNFNVQCSRPGGVIRLHQSVIHTEDRMLTVSITCISSIATEQLQFTSYVESSFQRNVSSFVGGRSKSSVIPWLELLAPSEGVIEHPGVLSMHFKAHNILDPANTMMEIYLPHEERVPLQYPLSEVLRVSYDSESLGTHVVHVTPILQGIKGLTTSMMFEIVPSLSSFQSARKYFVQVAASLPLSLSSLTIPTAQTHAETVSQRPTTLKDFDSQVHVDEDRGDDVSRTSALSLTGTKVMQVAGGVFDGQLKVFADQWRALKGYGVSFCLLWVCSSAVCDVDPVTTRLLLDHPEVRLLKLPVLIVKPEHLSQKTSDGDSYAELSHSRNPNTSEYDPNTVYEYLVKRFRMANRVVSATEPKWVRDAWQVWTEALGDFLPDIVVIGNTGEVADIIAPEIGMAVGVRGVVLEVGTSIVPPHALLEGLYRTVVGPSRYAVSAFSSLSSSPASNTDTNTNTNTSLRSEFVVSPGVDLELVDAAVRGRSCPFRCSNNSSTSTAAALSGCEVNDITGRCCKGRLVVGFVGRLVSVKACGMFLMAAKLAVQQFKDVMFVVVGSADRLGLRDYVQFVGQLRHPDIAVAYAGMDLLVVTSTNRMETFSVVNIEAMAAGVPVVSFGTYGQGENLTPPETPDELKSGVIVDEPSPESVASAVLSLLRNSTRRIMYGRNARKIVENRFSATKMGRGYADVYLHALQRS